MNSRHYFYIWNDLAESGVVVMPHNTVEALDTYLSKGLTEDIGAPVKVIDVKLEKEPNDLTQLIGFFTENRLGEAIEWSVKYIGELSAKERFGFIVT
jgi:hypothetical protein